MGYILPIHSYDVQSYQWRSLAKSQRPSISHVRQITLLPLLSYETYTKHFERKQWIDKGQHIDRHI